MYGAVPITAQDLTRVTLYPGMEIDSGFTMQLEQLLEIARGMLTVVLAAAAVLTLLTLIARWRIFVKAGAKGWKVLIPFYGLYTQLKFTWRPSLLRWYILLPVIAAAAAEAGRRLEDWSWLLAAGLVLLVCAVAMLCLHIALLHKLSRAFGHGGGFTVGLLFLPLIFLWILAFSRDRYRGKPL